MREREVYLQQHCAEIDASIMLSCRAPIDSKPSHKIFQTSKLRYYWYASRWISHVARFQDKKNLRKTRWQQSQPNAQNYTVAEGQKN